jgi:hypothetical protein
VYCGPPEFTLIGGTGWTVNEELTDNPFKVAVVVTLLVVVAADVPIVYVAEVCPDASATEAGLLNVVPAAAVLSATTMPETGAGAFRAIAQMAEAGTVINAGEHCSDWMVGSIWITLLVEIATVLAAGDAPRTLVS